jgi:hypothetical protein
MPLVSQESDFDTYGLLSIDGETLIQRKMNCVHGTGPLKFAVYLHLYDPQ